MSHAKCHTRVYPFACLTLTLTASAHLAQSPVFGVHTIVTTLHEAMATVADKDTLQSLETKGELDVPVVSSKVSVQHEEEAMSDHDINGELVSSQKVKTTHDVPAPNLLGWYVKPHLYSA